MALDELTKCRRTLARLRSGPLADLIEGFCQWLQERDYDRTTIRTHLSRISRLDNYFLEEGLEFGCDNPLSMDAIDGFIEAYPARCRHRGPLKSHLKGTNCSLNRFVDYLREVDLIHTSPKHEIYAPVLATYIDWMRDYRHSTSGTLRVHRMYIVHFLKWLGPLCQCM